ncbi:MAG: DUF2156 domain-containing protein [Candidatus Portnoybacteria bacterium]|nr:DUF2156 domain-containing protein [Candidatus Portnoybacteria bacterium]
MKIIKNVCDAEEIINPFIEKHGHLPEHHYHFYLNYGREKEENIFIDLGNQKGILAYKKENIWRILTDPTAPQKEKKQALCETIDWIFIDQKAKKIILEDITEDLRNQICAEKSKIWRAAKTVDLLSWPIIDLENWDAELSGKRWKRLRNMQNKFFKENRVKVIAAQEARRADLKNLVLKWKKQRSGTDRAHYPPYLKFIENDFCGCDMAQVMMVNGQPASLCGGWAIPNSKDYYSSIGIYDYDFNDIGEISYLDELGALKKKGYQRVDFGGSGEKLLAFKMKFHPISIYRTHTFSILKKERNF